MDVKTDRPLRRAPSSSKTHMRWPDERKRAAMFFTSAYQKEAISSVKLKIPINLHYLLGVSYQFAILNSISIPGFILGMLIV